jgi:hypothetical protein
MFARSVQRANQDCILQGALFFVLPAARGSKDNLDTTVIRVITLDVPCPYCHGRFATVSPPVA